MRVVSLRQSSVLVVVGIVVVVVEMRWRRIAIILFMGAVAITIILCSRFTGNDGLYTTLDGLINGLDNETTPKAEFVIIFCEASSNNLGILEVNLTRHLRQISVLLKSAAALTSTTLKFNIITDTTEMYHDIINVTRSWPEAYRSRLIFDNTRVFYPPKTEEMRDMFRPCATERLFLPQIFPQKDALIFLDTDLLFMQPPEDLWKEFQNFEERHSVGISPCLYMYGPGFKKFPTFGSSGVNAGVILMNLTRLNHFPLGWLSTIVNVTRRYKGMLKLADQDILNIIFSRERSNRLYELGCEWNYRQMVCSEGWNKCPGAASRGVALLHGAAMTFMNGQERQLQAVFEAWEKYQLERPLTELLELLETALDSQGSTEGCGKLSNIKSILIKGLERHIRLQDREKILKHCKS
ncbi:glucoside xylosyltransferase 1 isoform X1 [Procambarus clarkii]|uniref:glucoside xylosyltransferase 1 isoform X1 n=1 Tax=Procambarus clarkii TaxID=6728 RepID=UPI001E670039|nr:glucoside xylosyltransferase 1-like isoform X1 [Procambarus clarkii]